MEGMDLACCRSIGWRRQSRQLTNVLYCKAMQTRCRTPAQLWRSMAHHDQTLESMVRQNQAPLAGGAMLSLHDCIGMSGLTEEEIAIIAEHEHLSLIVAAELGSTLLDSPKGVFTLRGYIVDVLAQAKLAGQREKAKRVDVVLTRFIANHPVPRVLR
jgi:hypothetical protein